MQADGPALSDRALAAGKGHETVQELADDDKFFEWAARTYPRARFTGPSVQLPRCLAAVSALGSGGAGVMETTQPAPRARHEKRREQSRFFVGGHVGRVGPRDRRLIEDCLGERAKRGLRASLPELARCRKRRGCSGLSGPAALWPLGDALSFTLSALVCLGQIQMCHLDTARGIWRRSCPAETMSGAW